ncbi:MAG: aldehyde ferredoxin oxidoreductase family protein [Deltaproteobacteria bacterium]|nr:aldehyde ferredoxin oxidoreductase family protein [Deltaproteobacteria bacterium]MBW2418623.1 aldehyde ferredoxin oxidoreductase family protein [Deltaproteobacteria bacterium]
MIKGYAGRVLEVDLSAGHFAFQPLDEEIARLYIGGKGYGTRLLYDSTEPGIDPLGPANPLIFATGPLNGSVAPQSNRFAVVCKSPLTGGIGNATCGGSFALGLKKAGIDILVVKGRAQRPTRLEIDGDAGEVQFLDAGELWGMGTYETQERLGKQGREHAVIGPAGENQVLYAGIVSNERIAGRTGVGAVMGSKLLKAVSVKGSRKLDMEDPEKFKEYTKQVRGMFKEHPVLGGSLKRFGTGGILNTTNARNILPTRNFQRGHFDDAMNISGEYMEDHGLVGVKSSCIHCPVTCGRDVELPGRGRVKGPEYETLALLGSNLEIGDLERVNEWNYLADDFGMDTISLGASLSFAMELQERGLFRAGLSFGDPDGVSEMIRDIAHRHGTGNELADGTRRMSEKYGGREFAMHVKGLELSAYDPRGSFAQGVEYATTNRGGCHVQGASMYMESVGPLTINPQSLRLKADIPVVQQNLACAINSMVLCIFTTYGIMPKLVHDMDPNSLRYRALATAFEHSGPLFRTVMGLKSKPMFWFEKWLSFITGTNFSGGHLQETGARIFNLERMYNLREGLSGESDTLPPRMLNEPIFDHMDSGHPLGELLPRYYRIRGWDAEGVPLPATLEKLRVRV